MPNKEFEEVSEELAKLKDLAVKYHEIKARPWTLDRDDTVKVLGFRFVEGMDISQIENAAGVLEDELRKKIKELETRRINLRPTPPKHHERGK